MAEPEDSSRQQVSVQQGCWVAVSREPSFSANLGMGREAQSLVCERCSGPAVVWRLA